jgi:hypothetical protein
MSTTQPLDRIEFAEREFEEYREYAEAWKQEHDELATRCWAIEDVISKANYVYDRIASLDAELKKHSTCEDVPEFYVRNQYLLRSWFTVSSSLESRALNLEAEYGHVEGADDLRKNIAKAREDIRSSQTVTIDSAGYVYETTGERAIVPGLDPERVIRGMDDARAGRTRSLKDIIAARTGAGV